MGMAFKVDRIMSKPVTMRKAKFDIGTVLTTNSGHRYVVTSNTDWASLEDNRTHTLTPQEDWIAYQKQVMEEACRKLTMVQDQ
jgi:hypothetical protein